MVNYSIALVILSFSFQVAYTQSWEILGDAPNSGRYDDIYFHNEMLGWAVNSGGRILRTENGGQNWTEVYDNNGYNRSVRFLNESVGMVGTLSGNILRTEDGGDTWVDVSNQIHPNGVPGICGFSHFDNSFYGVGIWSNPAYFIRSDDQGVSWTYKEMDVYADALVECHFINSDTGFVSGLRNSDGGVILKTEDGGDTWVEVHNTEGGTEYIWKLDFVSEQVVYGSIESFSSNASRIVKSIDGGNTWVNLEVSPSATLDLQGIGFLTEERGWVGPRSEPMYETNDGGLTWSPVSGYPPNINRIFRMENGNLIACGDNIYKYTSIVSTEDDLVDHSHAHALSEIYPNPFTEHISFKVRIDKRTFALIDLFDSKGIHVKTFYSDWMDIGTYDFVLKDHNDEKMTSGVYTIVLRTNHGFHSKSIVKTK